MAWRSSGTTNNEMVDNLKRKYGSCLDRIFVSSVGKYRLILLVVDMSKLFRHQHPVATTTKCMQDYGKQSRGRCSLAVPLSTWCHGCCRFERFAYYVMLTFWEDIPKWNFDAIVAKEKIIRSFQNHTHSSIYLFSCTSLILFVPFQDFGWLPLRLWSMGFEVSTASSLFQR